MLEKLLSITGVRPTSIKPSEFTGSEKSLPPNNSLVKLDILDKIGSSYKLLIEGKLFQSRLPVDINIGEMMLARVISQQPFTLSLDSIVNLQNLTGNSLSLLLGKLQIKDTETSQKILKGFLNNKKLLEKSKLEKLIEILESEDFKIDDIQLGLLIQLLSSSNDGFSSLNKSLVQIFSYPVKELLSEILNSVQAISSTSLPQNLVNLLNESFVVNVEHLDENGGIRLKNYSNQVNGFLEFLSQTGIYSETNPDLSREINKLKNVFIRYNLQKAYLLRIGILTEFIIIKDGGKLELLKYELKSPKNNKNGEVYQIQLEMHPEQLGYISIDGYISGNSLQATISSSEKTCTVFASEKESIAEKLQNTLNIKANLNFGVNKPEKNESGNNPPNNTGLIDVTI